MTIRNYEQSLEKARRELVNREAQSMAANSGSEFNQNDNFFRVVFLGDEYRVKYPEGAISGPVGTEEIQLPVQILILHYLLNSGEGTEQGKFISYKELPGGSIYIGPFTQRAINPLVRVFGREPEALWQAAQKLGGQRQSMGDVSVTVPVFPKVPVTLVLWGGDEEFPPSGNILFDASAPEFLPTEDYAFIGGLLVNQLKRCAGK